MRNNNFYKKLWENKNKKKKIKWNEMHVKKRKEKKERYKKILNKMLWNGKQVALSGLKVSTRIET